MENDFIKHQIYLNRYSSSLYKDALPELKKMRDEISAKLLATPSNTFDSARLEYLLRDLKIIIDTTINGAINPKLFEDLALYEQEFALKVLDGATPASVVISGGINAAVLLPEVMASTMQLQGVKGKQTIEDVIKTFSDAHYKDIESEIRRGIAEGLTTDEIVNKIKYLSDNRTKAQCEAVIRTLTNHIATTARSATFKQYEELFVGEKFRATLDSRTTIQCGVRDGGIWTFEGKPVNAIAKANAYRRPALHYNCRSILVPELKPEYDLNIDSTRSSEFGQVSDKLTYSDWLKKQSPAFQDDVLGKARGKLFRDGTLTLDKFVDKKGAVLTLEELGVKEGVAKVVIPKATIPTIKFGYDGKFDGYVANIRDEAKIVIDKLPKPYNIKEKGSSYQSMGAVLSAGGDRVQTFRHEYGHHIDFVLGAKKATGGKYNGASFSGYSENNFLELLELDKKHLKITPKTYDTTLKPFVDEFGQMTKIKRVQLEYEMYKLKDEDFGGISDILDAMTGGDLQNRYLGMGHGKAYYKRKEAREHETFANLFELYATNNKWGRAKELFPNLTGEFENIMKKVIDGKFD